MGTDTITTLLLAGGLVILAIVLMKVLRRAKGPGDEKNHCDKAGGCCGGANCHKKTNEKDTLPVYFDDEELDRFKGRSADSYTDEETAEFIEVYDTLRTEERESWLLSLARRGIELPATLQAHISIR